MDNKFVKGLLYEKSKEEVLKALEDVDATDILYVYMYNYNWDEGFVIPKKILTKTCCDLSTALMMFYSVEGERYLIDKQEVEGSNLSEWSEFLQELYYQIINGKFQRSNILFKPPFNKIQLYKMQKILQKEEEIFIEEFGEKNLDIVL